MDAEPAWPPSLQTARDGTPVRLRPMRESDGELVRELFGALSPESVYARFLSPLARLDEARVRSLTTVDPRCECAVAACVDLDGRERLVSVGRFRCESDGVAEIAIAVADAWHRRGVGRMVLRRLTEVARDMGIRWFDSTIDPSNLRLLRFADACGFKGTLQYRDGLLKMRTDVAALFPEVPRDPLEGQPRP